MQATRKLYCLHAIGPDEVHAAPSKAEADKARGWYEQRFAEAGDPEIRFEVIEWPHSPESHAEEVLKWADVNPYAKKRGYMGDRGNTPYGSHD